MMRAWRNWSGTARCRPARIAMPTDEAGLVAAVAAAGRDGLPIRAAGTGHSFNPLATTDGLLLDLTRYTGVLHIDAAKGQVTVRCGTLLSTVNQALHAVGLGLPNIGTLGEQTVGGAIGTGNHGTGIGYPPLSGHVTTARLVTADGSVHELAPGSEQLRCARTALGALGVLSTVTLRCVPSCNLRVELGSEALDGLLDRFPHWAGSADQVSLSWPPWTDRVTTRAWHTTTEPASAGARRRRYAATVDEMWCGLTGLAARAVPAAVPGLVAGWGRATGTPRGYVDVAHRVATFPQPVRFVALEHALPLDGVPDALRALRGALRRADLFSPYPVLVRVGAADDAPLSPAYGRRTGYVNLTVPRAVAYQELLRTVEHVLRERHGRPHWGKAHTATAEILAPRYPEWDAFQAMRAALDPTGRFTNDYLRRVLGPVRLGVGAPPG